MSKKDHYIIAVSGGVDSVVLLDMASKWEDAECVVAHFDHGIRDESANDALFVEALAKKYGLTFESRREELGKGASEEVARNARYGFLREVAKKYNAWLVTAHHGDDVVETIVINLLRGTGWRGLSSLRSGEVYRPLLSMRKNEIIRYARDHQLEWREDATNSDPKYLRNYVRRTIIPRLGEQGVTQLLELYRAQVALAEQIDKECATLIRAYRPSLPSAYRRHALIMADEKASVELLRAMCIAETGARFERPQLARALLAVKTFLPGKRFEMGQGVIIEFSRSEIIVSRIQN